MNLNFLSELDDEEQFEIYQVLQDKFGAYCNRLNGVSFLMKDGTVDDYDTNDFGYFEFLEDEEFYIVKMTSEYKIPKVDVLEYKFYNFSFQRYQYPKHSF